MDGKYFLFYFDLFRAAASSLVFYYYFLSHSLQNGNKIIYIQTEVKQ